MRSTGRFRSMLYIVLGLSLTAYSIAIESLGHMVVALALVSLHAMVRRRHPAFAIPRYLASLLAVTTGAWATVGLLQGTMNPLMAVSQWLYFLVLITLWSSDDNRAFAQGLIMSLVLMVAGAINSASLIYGILLIFYLILSLYACLLFHLKVETEAACKAYQLDEGVVEGVSTPQNRASFMQSMRRLTTLISVAALCMGVGVFLFFPRSNVPSAILRFGAQQSSPMTGFSERVGFDQVARITQNTDVVAHVAISEDGKLAPLREIYLRGLTLDIYTGKSERRPSSSWQWVRSESSWDAAVTHPARSRAVTEFGPVPSRKIHQHISLLPTGSATLFALDGVSSITPERDMNVHYLPMDGTIRAVDVATSSLQYDVVSSGHPPPYVEPDQDYQYARQLRQYYRGWGNYTPFESRIDPAVAQYARRPEVSGQDAAGPLAERRGTTKGRTPLDELIADNIARHLQKDFRYTLDLTDVRRDDDSDPLVGFLYDFKRGHCEYFAGAMALMCQSLGMKARVVIGFRAGPEDFNKLGDYYVVRQSHAHAWTEVLTESGWKSYDPTAAEYFSRPPSRGFLSAFGDLFDLLQYKWASSVVTYSNSDRKTVWSQVEGGVNRSFSSGRDFIASITDFLQSSTAYELSSKLIIAALALLVLILLVAVGLYIAEKRRLYRRAQRIGLSSLPTAEQLRLAKQLGFYDEMLKLLARHRIARPPTMTPREFAASLSFLAPDAHDKVCRVTDVFYRIRFGNHHATPGQRRALYQAIDGISAAMDKTPAAATISSAP